jgi:hypothetical protein
MFTSRDTTERGGVVLAGLLVRLVDEPFDQVFLTRGNRPTRTQSRREIRQRPFSLAAPITQTSRAPSLK